MKFAPKPENDFYEYIRTYYRECRSRFPKIEAIAGKWMYRDLIPGMSDFDTRFILNDEMTAGDWCRLSGIVGEAHLELAHRYPLWWRNLEHLPGVNLTWGEIFSERQYYTEYQLWTYYFSEDPVRLGNLQHHLAARPWDQKDEYFHLSRFVTYYGRYNRSIDPAINLGVHENKYPLHSRIMHYFNPPVHSAVCLLEKRNLPGKMGAFEQARRLFPGLACWDIVDEILHANYELAAWYDEPWLVHLEDVLEEALQAIAGCLPDAVTQIGPLPKGDVLAWKHTLREMDLDPVMLMFEKSRFSRLFKGRLYFYLHAPAGFDRLFLIRNELGRVGSLFFKEPFRLYWKNLTGEKVEDPLSILDQLRGRPLTDGEIEAAREFAQLTLGDWRGREFAVSERLVEIYDEYYRGLHRIVHASAAV